MVEIHAIYRPPMAKAKILIVDDDREFCSMLEDVLGLKGYVVCKSFSGSDAIKLLEKENVNLVITDKNMPGLGGVDVILKIKADYPTIPVIITTAFGDKKFKEESLRAGAFQYFSKPVKMASLLEAITKALPVNS